MLLASASCDLQRTHAWPLHVPYKSSSLKAALATVHLQGVKLGHARINTKGRDGSAM